MLSLEPRAVREHAKAVPDVLLELRCRRPLAVLRNAAALSADPNVERAATEALRRDDEGRRRCSGRASWSQELDTAERRRIRDGGDR